jgi:hypothetical protein
MMLFRCGSAAALALLALGCGPDFDDEKKLAGYRVIGVQAEPPEVDPDGQVTLSVFDHDSEGDRPRSYAWSVCLLNPGDISGFECLDPALEFPLDSTGPMATMDLGPDGLGVRRLFETFGPVRGIDGRPITLEDGFEIYAHLVSSAEGGREISTYKRIRIRDGDGLNGNPSVTQIEVDGETKTTIKAGQTVELKVVVDESTRDVRPDGNPEIYNFRWFTVDGVIEDAFGPETAVTDYTPPAEPGEDTVFVVVRDGQGGAVLESITFTLTE